MAGEPAGAQRWLALGSGAVFSQPTLRRRQGTHAVHPARGSGPSCVRTHRCAARRPSAATSAGGAHRGALDASGVVATSFQRLLRSRRDELRRNMKMKCAALTIAVALAVGFHATPLTAPVPPQGRVYRLGMLSVGKDAPGTGVVHLGGMAGHLGSVACSRLRGRPQRRPRSPICATRRSIGFRPSRLSWSGSGWISSSRVGRPPRVRPKRRPPRFPYSSAWGPIRLRKASSPATPGRVETSPGSPTADNLDLKRLEYLKRAVPGAVRIAILKSSGGPREYYEV